MPALTAARSSLNAVVPGLPLGDILLGNIGSFKHGFVFEVIDTRKTGIFDGALMTKSLVLNPRRYTLSEPFAVTLTPTEDNTVVAEENGQIIREIVIEGTTGLEKRKETALGRGGSIGTRATGVDHFYQLRDVFREYGKLKQKPEDAPHIKMIFHNVKEDDHFVVVPRSFETPRDASSNRFHFNYRITLAAIQSLPPPPDPNSLFGALGALGDTLSDISEAVNDLRASLVEMIELIDVYRERIEDPGKFLEDTARSINDANDFVEGVRDVINVSIEATIALNELINEIMGNNIDGDVTPEQFEACREIAKARKGQEKIAAHPEAFQPPLAQVPAIPYAGARNHTQQDIEDNTAGAKTGTRTRLALGSDRNAGLDLGLFNGSRRTTIGPTDDIDAVAVKNGVPRPAIIALNNLRYPFITRGGGPGTLEPGDDILIPTRSPAAQSGASPNAPYLTPDDMLYGVDISLNKKLMEEGVFDIEVDEVHGAMGVSLVRGKENVVQGTGISIGTERGSTNFIPDLGIKRTPGIQGTVDNMLLASLYLRETILGDPRIVGIDSSRIVLEGDRLTQEITPQLIDARDGVLLTVPFGKAAS